MTVLESLEVLRAQRIQITEDAHKANFGQYLTPNNIAEFMAELLVKYGPKNKLIRLLDPGAGLGILYSAFLEKIYATSFNGEIAVDAYEIDQSILLSLEDTSKRNENNLNIKIQIHDTDFIKAFTQELVWSINKNYSHVIMNPPYKKIRNDSEHQYYLKRLGIESGNLYTAFLSLSILALEDNGVIVAIVPRSFCNGLYFLPFRKFLFAHTEIMHIHSFESRRSAFKEESVLQENIIVVLRKGTKQSPKVTLSSTRGRQFNDYLEKQVSFDSILKPEDPHKYIYIPALTTGEQKNYECIATTSEQLKIDISTGPIVDFRMKEKLIFHMTDTATPLLYPIHLRYRKFNWPIDSKKPNGIVLDDHERQKLTFLKGDYVLINRFSSKEEKRRVKASLVKSNDLPFEYFTIENHINVIHKNKQGIHPELAAGLYVYYNTEYFDTLFREFSGHTQVNATDLRNIKYPMKEQLKAMGRVYLQNECLAFDFILKTILGEDE